MLPLPSSLPLSLPVPDRDSGVGWHLWPWQECSTTTCSECARQTLWPDLTWPDLTLINQYTTLWIRLLNENSWVCCHRSVGLQVALHQIKWLPGQSSRCTVKFIRSECKRLWLVHICDSGDLCRYFDIYPMYSVAFVVWWIITQWHLPLVGIWSGCKYCNWHFVWIRRLPL